MVETASFEADPVSLLLSPWRGWKGRDEFLSLYGRELSERGRLLLFSDGSLVKSLEALFMEEILIDVEAQQSQTVAALSGKEKVWLKRGVWLQRGAEKLVFAFSIIPVNTLSPLMLERILRGSKPLGLIVEESMPFYRKEGLQFGILHWPERSVTFGFPEDCRLWARRYKIITHKGPVAFILEVFSPALMEKARKDALP